MNQLVLSFTRARRTDPATSKQAAINADRFAASHAGRILEALKVHGPRTAHSLEGLTRLTTVQIDRRLPELARKGLARVVKLDDGADAVQDGCRVWEAI